MRWGHFYQAGCLMFWKCIRMERSLVFKTFVCMHVCRFGAKQARKEGNSKNENKLTSWDCLVWANSIAMNPPRNTTMSLTDEKKTKKKKKNKTERENQKQLCEVKATTEKLTSPSLDAAMMRRWCLQKVKSWCSWKTFPFMRLVWVHRRSPSLFALFLNIENEFDGRLKKTNRKKFDYTPKQSSYK